MKHKCTSCGHEDEINPAALLGAIRTPKKEAAWKANGERLKRMYANARKVEQVRTVASPISMDVFESMEKKPLTDDIADTRGWDGERVFSPSTIQGIMPKGSMTKEDLKAMLAGGKPVNTAPATLSETPHAPFDVNLEGEPHRVTQMGKKLGLFYVGGGEPVFSRYISDGELAKYWAARIK